MRFPTISRVLLQQHHHRKSLSPFHLSFSHHLHSQSNQSDSNSSSFGIAFDIDGVIIRGNSLIGNSAKAIRRLYGDSGGLRIPYVFLTNGGGYPESKRASELSSLLGVNISTSQVLQGHTPFRDFVDRYENELVVAIGKGEPATVMSEYGFKKVLSIDEYASCFDNIDPLSRYKNWASRKELSKDGTSNNNASRHNAFQDRVQAAFVVSDSVDWSRDIQVLCDILRTGGLPGREIAHQPPLYFASDDLEYQAAFPSNRLGMGAFRIALEAIYNRIHPKALEFTSFGKPHPFVFKNAEAVLKQLQLTTVYQDSDGSGCQTFKTLYMIGDNPSVDIRGARKAGQPWFSILTRTGVFKGEGNHEEFPADLVVDTVEDAVDYILRRECRS
ncbi:hypothetical protein ACHQM5_021659 [Ranunculus cassubicifolius]